MKKCIVFDADDTLWDEQAMLQGFEKAVEQALDQALGRKSNFAQVFIDLENKNIPHIGYGFPSYMFSVGEALAANPEWYAHKDKILDRVREVIRQFTLQGPRLIDGVPETLQKLKDAGFELYVLTRGVEFEQLFKLEKSGIKHFFRDVAIVPKKDRDTYLAAAKLFNIRAENLCMAGNSVKADVNPAVEAGWRAIHIPAPTAWAHDEAELSDSPRAHRVSRFSDIPALVGKPEFWG